MSFEEEYPSFEGDSRWCPASIADPYSDSKCYWAEEAIKEHTLDKQRVKEAIFKYTQGTKYVRHEDCSKPYGDDCGYCEFCLQAQKELQNKIFKELGLEDE